MIRQVTIILAILGADLAVAETLVPARTIRSQTIISAVDLTRIDSHIPGAFSAPKEVIGKEALVNLYPGRPIMPGDIGPPALVERNQVVSLIFTRGGLRITSEARALNRAGVGDRIRVMNLESRLSVSGIVMNDGSVQVGGF